MQFKDPIAQIINRVKTGTKLHVCVTEQQDLAALCLERANTVKSVAQEDGHIVVELKEQTTDFSHLARLLLDNKFKIREIKEEEVNLETAFMRLTKGLIQ